MTNKKTTRALFAVMGFLCVAGIADIAAQIAMPVGMGMPPAVAAAPLIMNQVGATSPAQDGALPISSKLFFAGYNYGKLFRYYSRSLANFDRLTIAQQTDDRENVRSLLLELNKYARSLGCSQRVLQALLDLEDELDARARPRESRLSQIDSIHECIDNYDSALGGYWWTGRSVGSLSFLFDNLDHPQVELRSNSSDSVLLEELKYLMDNSALLWGTEEFPPRAEEIIKTLGRIRMANLQTSELDTATRSRIRQYINEIPKCFLRWEGPR